MPATPLVVASIGAGVAVVLVKKVTGSSRLLFYVGMATLLRNPPKPVALHMNDA